ncbi:glycoside hydrolase family 88 protein [Haloarcula hispanica]|nr:glycoside hydrolase family 88 protein [Haloarcula hispanica]
MKTGQEDKPTAYVSAAPVSQPGAGEITGGAVGVTLDPVRTELSVRWGGNRPAKSVPFRHVMSYVAGRFRDHLGGMFPSRSTTDEDWRCQLCHLPPVFSDAKFAVIGVDDGTDHVYLNGNRIGFDAGKRWKRVDIDVCEPGENVVTCRSTFESDLWLALGSSIENVNFGPGQYVVSSGNPFETNDHSRTRREHHVGHTDETLPLGNREAAVQFILDSQNEKKGSQFQDTFHGCYDYHSNRYMLSSWIWCSGLAIRALVSEWDRTSRSAYRKSAIRCGKKLLQLQHDNGAFTVRWDFPRNSPTGIQKWEAPNDSAFIAANGLLPLYRVTGESRYLDGAKDVAAWILDEGMRSNGQLGIGRSNEWDFSWLYVDAGFTTDLFYRLYEIDGEERWRDACERFVKWFVDNLYDGNGSFKKTWYADGEDDRSSYTRGQGWALDGLISAYQLLHNDQLRDIIEEVAMWVVDRQCDNGSWLYATDNSHNGEDNKATPLLAYELLRAEKVLDDATFLPTVRTAIQWCEDAQHYSDRGGYGGIRAWNIEGTIVGNRNTTTAFLYGNAYYILAKNGYLTAVG